MSKVLTRLQDSITDRPTGFITEWEINGGDRSITLPLYNSGTFNCTVDWGDGTQSTISSWNSANKTHTYAADRRYRVEITGDCPAWSFYDTGTSSNKIRRILRWGDAELFNGFSYLVRGFYQCYNLNYMPYKGSIIAKNNLTSAFRLFAESGIKNVSIGLFDLCVNVSDFTYTFEAAFNLRNIPNYLFRNTLNATSFFQTFYYTGNLSLNKYIFFAFGEENTRFLNKSINFNKCFFRDAYNGIQGEAPKLWSCNFGTGTPTKTDCFDGAGNSLASLANYNDIPADWK